MSELQKQIKQTNLTPENIEEDVNIKIGEEIFSSKKKILSLALGEFPFASFLFWYKEPWKLTEDLIKIRAVNDSDYKREVA